MSRYPIAADLTWSWINERGITAQSKTPFGYYTIVALNADEYVLEYHNHENGFGEWSAFELATATNPNDLTQLAQKDHESRASKVLHPRMKALLDLVEQLEDNELPYGNTVKSDNHLYPFLEWFHYVGLIDLWFVKNPLPTNEKDIMLPMWKKK